MISIREVSDPNACDQFEEGLLLPVPDTQSNCILLEDRDGDDVRRITARGATVELDGRKIAGISDVRIDVFITDARVALACSKYDKGGGWIGGPVALALNASSKGLAAARRRGKMLVGQVRYPWISSVGSTTKLGWLSEERLYLRGRSGDGKLVLILDLPKNIDAASVAAEVARRAAAYRLCCEADVKPEVRSKLQEMTTAERIEPAKDTVLSHVFPTYWYINEKSARFRPGGANDDPPTSASPPPSVAEPANAPLPLEADPIPVRPSTPPCPSCGAETRPGIRFCPKCGNRLEAVVGPHAQYNSL